MAKHILTETLSEPLGNVKTATVEISAGTGHLTIDQLPGDEPALASGALQYLENQDAPARALSSSNGRATLALRSGEAPRSWFRLPWDACGGAYTWQVHLNPTVASAITAHSDGGNLKLDLAGMAVTQLVADTGGGNIEVVLPDHATNLSASARTGGGNVDIAIGYDSIGSATVSAESGAGNVVVQVPRGLAARVYAASGLGKVSVDPRFSKLDGSTYQTPDYDAAADRVAITIKSGAGNVSVDTR